MNATSGAFSASASGAIVYRRGSASLGQRQLVWFDRSGKELGKVGQPINPAPWFSLSPDGHTIALGRSVNVDSDVWLFQLDRGTFVRLTSNPGIDNWPVWSPDGQSVVFESYAGGHTGDLYVKSLKAEGQELLLSTPAPKFPTDWSRDGRFILYAATDPKTGLDIWALPLTGDRKPIPVAQTVFSERDARFSPDGQWIAYESDESGQFEVYVKPFRKPGAKLAVSNGGGEQPAWRADGRELFYVASDGRLMAVPIRVDAKSESLEPGAAVPLFATHTRMFADSALGRAQYMVSPDGQRFLVASDLSDANTFPITIVLNWQPGLPRGVTAVAK